MSDVPNAGPGIGAFLAFFFLAVALWLLMRNMSARMRRMAYRERERLGPSQQPAADPEAFEHRPSPPNAAPGDEPHRAP